MKKFLCLFVILAVCSLHANVNPLEPKDRIELGKINAILWKEGELTEADSRVLEEAIHFKGHDDVRCLAISTAIARHAPGVQDIIESTAATGIYTARRIAEHFQKLGGAPTIERLTQELQDTDSEYRQCTIRMADDYCRDILVYMMVLRARKGKKAPFELPKGITFDTRHQWLATLAIKPEKEAWPFLLKAMKQLPEKEGDKCLALAEALSTYSRLFYEEAMEGLESDELSYSARMSLLNYLALNQGRMSPEQQERLWKRRPELKRHYLMEY